MKRKWKGLAAASLALMLVATGCGKKLTPAESSGSSGVEAGKLKGEITVQAEKEWVEYYQKAVNKIVEANPEAKITIKTAASFDHLKIIQDTDANNADVADVFALPADRFMDLAGNDTLAAIPAKDMAAELGGFDDFDKGLGGAFKLDKNYLAFPFNIETLVTFVNTKNAKDAGIDTTKSFELTEQQKAATILLPLFDAWYGVAPNNAGGIELLKKDGDSFQATYSGAYGEMNAGQKAVFDAIYKYWKLNSDEGTVLFDTEAGWGYVDDAFKSGGDAKGHVGVVRLGGPWDAAAFEKATEGNMEVYPIGKITIAGKPLTHWQGGWALGINSRIEKDADKMALAQALIKELVHPNNAVDLYKATGKILENVKYEAYESSDLSALDKAVIKNVVESYKVSPPRPLFKEYGQVWDTWKNAVLSWNAKKPADAEAAYGELNAAFNAMMQQIKK